MNKNIKLAVAGAVLALSATAANAGIVIPAGDWTLDVSGNVNAYDIYSRAKGTATVAGGLATGSGKVGVGSSTSGMQNGLLPNFLSIGATTRQNDLDVSFLISLQPGTGNNTGLTQVGSSGNAGLNNRQAYLTFGDKSWGSVKLGKDLGIFASDAILNDMTLLGVGGTLGNSTSGGNTTLGRIGTGFIYADWKPQIAYTTPNFNGFQATVGISQAFTAASLANSGPVYTASTTVGQPANLKTAAVNYSLTGSAQSNPAYEGKASYSFATNDVTGKVWVSGMSQKANVGTAFDSVMYAADIGAHIDVAGFGLTGYYYGGSGVGTTVQGWDGYALSGQQRDSDGGYVQATYVLPTKTKVGLSWGQSNLDLASGETNANLVKTNEMWTVGVYHPLTKHLNLVAEYSYMTSTNQANQDNNVNVGDVGAILFF
jgi:predicted porin